MIMLRRGSPVGLLWSDARRRATELAAEGRLAVPLARLTVSVRGRRGARGGRGGGGRAHVRGRALAGCRAAELAAGARLRVGLRGAAPEDDGQADDQQEASVR